MESSAIGPHRQTYALAFSTFPVSPKDGGVAWTKGGGGRRHHRAPLYCPVASAFLALPRASPRHRASSSTPPPAFRPQASVAEAAAVLCFEGADAPSEHTSGTEPPPPPPRPQPRPTVLEPSAVILRTAFQLRTPPLPPRPPLPPPPTPSLTQRPATLETDQRVSYPPPPPMYKLQPRPLAEASSFITLAGVSSALFISASRSSKPLPRTPSGCPNWWPGTYYGPGWVVRTSWLTPRRLCTVLSPRPPPHPPLPTTFSARWSRPQWVFRNTGCRRNTTQVTHTPRPLCSAKRTSKRPAALPWPSHSPPPFFPCSAELCWPPALAVCSSTLGSVSPSCRMTP